MDKHLTYPLYHTFYETPFAVEHLMDVDHFSILKATAQYWIEMAVRLTETPTIPYSLHTLAMKLKSKYIPDLEKAIDSLRAPAYVKDGHVQLDHMKATCERFEVATRIKEAIQLSRDADPITRSQYNDRLIKFVERCFVNPRGAPGDASARHVLFSISKTNQYAGAVMQQVYRVINDMAETEDTRQLEALSDELANQISIVHNSVLCAVGVLADFI
ncbi:unnamed protein product [Heligmosomoides polygyrus]|uniref:TFR_dimer domain-containing protein n=1 Tax=Heligmosomoides polygyrus TaxID=6339 RepID=A0A183G7X8_HELPZ|nr:unnamed protein product [Heligmosomoides polygyrus]